MGQTCCHCAGPLITTEGSSKTPIMCKSCTDQLLSTTEPQIIVATRHGDAMEITEEITLT